MPLRSSREPPAQARGPNASDGDDKIAVNSEFSSLPEVVPQRPPLDNHHQHPSFSSSNPYLHANHPPSAYTTPLVSPLTPEATGAAFYGNGRRPSGPSPWSPGYFEAINPVSLNPLHPPLKPPPNYDYGEQPSPSSSQAPLAPGVYGPDPGYDGYSRPPGPPLVMEGPPPPMPFEPLGPPDMGPPPGGLGPVAAARRRRRLCILLGICCGTLCCIIAGVVGILLGVVHIHVKNNTRAVDARDIVLRLLGPTGGR
ncbi:hypothetical protein GQ53DRAFT_446294 [Thozetella sp. PMI_491]|nr:hypothetical protein GQ53DRAFT_446294 [Thozetella sp. PMI_491]